MARRVGLEQLPVLALAALLVLSLWLADVHVTQSVIATPSPFVPVWAAYRRAPAIHLVGWALAGLAAGASLPLGRPVDLDHFTVRAQRAVLSLMPWWLVVACGSLAVTILAKGAFLLNAPAYLSFTGPAVLASISGICLPLGVLASGVVSRRWPQGGRVLVALFAAALFAYATRVFAGVAVLYLMGQVFAGRRVSPARWVAAAVSVFVLLPMPLICRNQSHHGLLPYTQAMADQDFGSYFTRLPVLASENLGFTLPLLQYTAQARNITHHALLVQVNPLPAHMAGWDQLMPQMRVHLYIPYSMLGELASFGPAALAAGLFLWAVVVRRCIQSAATSPTRLMVLVVAVQIALAMLSMVEMTQYNTRTVARLLDIMLIGALADVATRPLQARLLGLDIEHPGTPALDERGRRHPWVATPPRAG